jgi:hypothetical protein
MSRQLLGVGGVILVAGLLLVPGAEARPHIPDADMQNVRATFALLDRIAVVANPDDNFVDGSGSCKRVKRHRWSCPHVVRVTVTRGEAPVFCTAAALVSPRWWRYPDEWSTCPVQWLPTETP